VVSLDTLASRATHTLEVKHSRFLAHAAPAETPEAALAFLAAVADPAATHNCWAYRVDSAYRSSDDGEPAGTAGRPILAAIDGQGYDRIVVVVTRWYGGINLGAGGLVRAYGGCAAECLRRAERSPLVATRELQLVYRFEDTGAVHAALAARNAEKLDEQFNADGVQLQVRLRLDRLDALKTQLRDATRDRIRISDPADHDRLQR
jgi:uncharacterized YigZ family protein